jgi:type IV pilus assembly protein PilM
MRILGIDLGSSSIKAVEMDSAFGRYDIHDYHEKPLEPGDSQERALAELFQALTKQPDRVAIAMQSGHTTFRNMMLPTKDKKSIRSGVGFELEDELPFPAEDSMNDFSVLLQSKQGSQLHVAATLKRHLSQAIENCQKSSVDPDVITTEAWAYKTLLNRVIDARDAQNSKDSQNSQDSQSSQDSQTPRETPVLLVQMGHLKTTFYLHWKGAPALIRDIAWGGNDLNIALCKRYEMTLEEAETAKIDRGFVSSAESTIDQSSEQTEFSQCLESELEYFLQELKQVDLMCRKVAHQHIGWIYLGGGTALLPGIAGWIAEKMKTPTKQLLSLSSMTTSGVTYSHTTDARFILAAALTLTQIGADRAVCINFRKGEFSKNSRSNAINLAAFKKPLIAAGIIGFSLFTSLVVQSSVYRSQLKTVDIQLERSVRSFFGQMSSSGLKTYMSNIKVLQSSISKELNKQRELMKLYAPDPHSPLEFLNSISSTIPKDIVSDLAQFQSGGPTAEPFAAVEKGSTASLTFLVTNPQNAEKLANLLNKKMSHMERSKLEEVTVSSSADTPALKKWKINFRGTPLEESNGN